MLKTNNKNESEEQSDEELMINPNGYYDSDNNVSVWKISDKEKEILSKLTGEQHLLNIKREKKTIGDYYYLQFRHILSDDNNYSLIEISNNNKTQQPINSTNLTTPNSKTKKKTTHIKKSELFQTENSLKMINEFFLLVLKHINICKESTSLIIPYELLQHDYLEINGIGFLCMLCHIKTNTHLYLEDNNIKPEYLSLIVNIIISAKKFINDVRDVRAVNIIPTKLGKISETLLDDLNKSLIVVESLYVTNGLEIIKKCQDLLSVKGFNYFDEEISLLNHQLILAKKVEEYFDRGFFLIFNSVIGSGKTMGIFGLIDIVKKKKLESNPNLEILYICNSESVRSQFINMCKISNLKFGEFKSGKYTYVNQHGLMVTEERSSMHDHHTCKVYTREFAGKREIRKVVNTFQHNRLSYSSLLNEGYYYVSDKCITITNLTGAIQLLEKCDQDKYIVCFDEPNDEADNINSFTLKNSMKIINLLTKRSILLSGTIPAPSSITPIINNIISKYNRIHIDMVNTQEITTGCLTMNYQTGEVFLPYYGVDTKEKLLKRINNLKSSPFLSRSCESNVLYHLYNLMKQHNIVEIDYLNDYFKNFDNLTSDKIKLSCINLLEILLKYSSDIIQSVCLQPLILKQLNINNLGTTNSHQLLNGQTIITSMTPLSTTLNMFADLLTDINNQTFVVHTIESILNNLSNHQTLLYGLPYEPKSNTENYFDNVDYKEDSDTDTDTDSDIDTTNITETTNLNKTNGLDKSKPTTHIYKNYTHMQKVYLRYLKYFSKIYNSDKLYEKYKSLPDKLRVTDKYGFKKIIVPKEYFKPKIFFDDEFQINTPAHQTKYNLNVDNQAHQTNQANQLKYRPLQKFDMSQLLKTRVDDDIISLFLAGIGIYDLNDARLDKPYLDMVLSNALEGNLSYIISNRNICYGISMPVYNIIVLDDFAQNCSIYDIGQLSGRAGRRNKSTSATMYLGQAGFERYLSYADNIQEADNFVMNMLEVFNSVISN